MNSLKVRNIYVIPELQNAWDRINMIGVCYLDREGVKERVGKILFLIDDLIGELKNSLEEGKK